MKELKQIARLKNNYSSSQMAEIHPLLRASRDQLTLQTKQLFLSLVLLVGSFLERMQSWRAILPFIGHRSQWREHRIWVCSRLLGLTTLQILGWKNYNELDNDLKVFQEVRFWKNICTQKSRFVSFYSMKTTYFTFFVLFKNAWFRIEIFITCQTLIWKRYNAADVGTDKMGRNIFWVKNFTTCQILNQLFKYASVFELNNLQHFRFWLHFFCSLPSFNVFIKTVMFW